MTQKTQLRYEEQVQELQGEKRYVEAADLMLLSQAVDRLEGLGQVR